MAVLHPTAAGRTRHPGRTRQPQTFSAPAAGGTHALQHGMGNAAVSRLLSAASGKGAVAGGPLLLSQITASPGGPTNRDRCRDLLQIIIELLDEVAERFRQAQDDVHELYKYHRGIDQSHPDYGSWEGHRKKFNEVRDELRRRLTEWDDGCGNFRMSQEQQKDLDEAREYAAREFPTKPLKAMREAEASEQESVWDKLRGPLPDWVVTAMIAAGLILLAGVLVVAFATGVAEFVLIGAAAGLVLGLAITAALRAAGVRDTSKGA